jgi:hypothetical protein
MSHVILMLHPMLGVLFILANVWIFADSLQLGPGNKGRVVKLCFLSAILMWLTYLIGGYWYVVYFAADKKIILGGPWPAAHTFFMEMKEHVLLMLVLLATYLPIAAKEKQPVAGAERSILLWVSGLNVLLGLVMDGAGAIISMGAKVALLLKV